MAKHVHTGEHAWPGHTIFVIADTIDGECNVRGMPVCKLASTNVAAEVAGHTARQLPDVALHVEMIRPRGAYQPRATVEAVPSQGPKEQPFGNTVRGPDGLPMPSRTPEHPLTAETHMCRKPPSCSLSKEAHLCRIQPVFSLTEEAHLCRDVLSIEAHPCQNQLDTPSGENADCQRSCAGSKP